MAADPTAAAAQGASPTSRTSLRRNRLQETEIEEMLSEHLVEGCVLMDKSCPACVTPLLKHTDDLGTDANDENSLKKVKSRETAKSTQTLTPIDGVPFCVACQAHVVTSSDEIDKVEEQKQSLKDLVLTALALDDEPLFFCDGTNEPLLKDMIEESEGQGYEVIQPEQWREDPSVRSRISKASSRKSEKSARSTTSQSTRMKSLAFEFADEGEVEIVRARSSFSATPKASFSQTSRKTERSSKNKGIQPSIKEDIDERREEEDVKEEGTKQVIGRIHEVEEHYVEKEIVVRSDLVDKTPGNKDGESPAGSIGEIDVKKECSVDAEELTADFLTIAESEDELLSYEEK